MMKTQCRLPAMPGWFFAVPFFWMLVMGCRVFAWEGSGSIETRWFPQSPSLDGQRSLEYVGRLDAGTHYVPYDRFRVTASFWMEWHSNHDFPRVDAPEFHAGYQEDAWRLRLGLEQINWGASDTFPVVDIVNQRARLDWPHRAGKLGQPALSLTLWPSLGQFDLHVLPFFRPFPFADGNSRFSPPLLIADDFAIFETGSKYGSTDFAMRYGLSLGGADLSLHYFEGRNRLPFLVPENELPEAVRPDPASVPPRLIPVYEDLVQVGMDWQYAIGAWLWKVEAAYREGIRDDYILGVMGFERTFFQWLGGGADLTWIVEYAYDQRGKQPSANTILDNDIFVGLRWATGSIASTEVKMGLLVDLDNQDQIRTFEWSRRIGGYNRVNIEIAHVTPEETSILSLAEKDSFIRMQWYRFF